MPVLPMIDLLILMGWSCLAVGGVLKAISLTTSYQPAFFGLGPLELLWIAGISLLFALALAARTWVKANEPQILARQRAASTLRAVESVRNGIGEYDRSEHTEDRVPSAGIAEP